MLAINGSPNKSQHAIARQTHLSSSMVNNYIKRLHEERLIRVEGTTNRNQTYHLTDAGHKSLREAFLAYSAEIVRLYGAVKTEISEILMGFFMEGVRSVVLFGVAETAEVVYAAIKQTPLVVDAVVDSDEKKQGKLFNGLVIQAPDTLQWMHPDAVVITSFGKQEEIYTSVKTLVPSKVKIKRLSEHPVVLEA
nr:winged helix-turn-helix transcriptional regulator [Desulfosarcina ovata]